MNKQKLLILSVGITLATMTCSSYAKRTWPAEILGRSLHIFGLGWIGHVGIATANISTVDGLWRTADLTIEVLNSVPVVQIGFINTFTYLSEFWGSKYGVATQDEKGLQVLHEANHQRWWCPEYTSDTQYHIGNGNLATGEIRECGKWRCDTYVWWAFYSQGWDTMPGRIWLPKVLFNRFPYYNNELLTKFDISLDTFSSSRALNDVTAEDLNAMPFEEFQMIMDAPPTNYITTQLISSEMRFAADDNLNNIKRGIMIDRLTSKGDEPDLIPKLLKLYNETNNTEVKEKIISGLMLYNQQHRNVKSYINNDQLLLKNYFAELLNSKSLTSKSTNTAIRGFLDLHGAEEIMENLDVIDTLLPKTDHYSSIMLKYSLVHKSKELQRIYIKSIINELREANNSDLDSYLFGPLSIGYSGTGKGLLDPDSRQLILEYLNDVRYKYTTDGINANPEDFHRRTTAPTYFELIKNMEI